jgi:hypothetical protein
MEKVLPAAWWPENRTRNKHSPRPRVARQGLVRLWLLPISRSRTPDFSAYCIVVFFVFETKRNSVIPLCTNTLSMMA